MIERVQQAFRLWDKPVSDGNPLATLRIYQRLQQQETLTARQVSNELLRRHLEQLRNTHPDECQILHDRYIEGVPAHIVATRLDLSDGNVFLKQKQGIHHLAEMLCQEEAAFFAAQRSLMQRRLAAPTYTQLFGVAALLEQLNTTLVAPQPPWIIAIEGLGGSGKTALADALVRQMIDSDAWHDLAWVTARQMVMSLDGCVKLVEKPTQTVEALVESFARQLLPELSRQNGASCQRRQRALCECLKANRYLVVIDNLETILDVESLLATLRTWVNPSKVLITTRQRLLSEADIFHFVLPELSEGDALQLERYEAQTRNLPDLLAASDDDLNTVYQTVGGNPLALRLLVGQLHLYSLDHLLNELHQLASGPILNLYAYIYRRAWEGLDEAGRTALLLMLLTSEQGRSFDELATLGHGKLTPEQLRHSLDQLIALNLVDSRGDLHVRRYTIHGLTRTFLHRDVMGW
jgi:hypothetical protein